MPKKIYALLVGINKYQPPISPLLGAVADVLKINDYLTSHFKAEDLDILILKDEECTYQNVTEKFRSHLGKAGKEDVVWFHYSGHGSRQTTAMEFESTTLGKKDETLVLYDSRPNGLDLSDKELAVLIAEVNANCSHIFITLDSCHSGSGTRSVDEDKTFRARLAEDRSDQRPLNTYLNGHYSPLNLEVPKSNHLLMAACSKLELAKETITRDGGLFTHALISSLTKFKTPLSYATLYQSLRQGIIAFNSGSFLNQNPQLEPIGAFNIYGRILDGTPIDDQKRYSLTYQSEAWRMQAGEILGIDLESEDIVMLFDDDLSNIGEGKISEVSAQESIVKPAIDLDFNKDYWAIPKTIKYLPFEIACINVNDETLSILQGITTNNPSFIFSNAGKLTSLALEQKGDDLSLIRLEDKALIQRYSVFNKELLPPLSKTLQHILQWTKIASMQTKVINLPTNALTINFKTSLNEVKSETQFPGQVTLQSGNSKVNYALTIQNIYTQPLHVALLYLTSSYGVIAVKNELVEVSDQTILFFGGDEDAYLQLPLGTTISTDRLMLIVSTERTDDFQIAQDELEMGTTISSGTRDIPGLRRKPLLKGAWYSHMIEIKLTN